MTSSATVLWQWDPNDIKNTPNILKHTMKIEDSHLLYFLCLTISATLWKLWKHQKLELALETREKMLYFQIYISHKEYPKMLQGPGLIRNSTLCSNWDTVLLALLFDFWFGSFIQEGFRKVAA